MTDYISRADAIDVLQQFAEDEKPNDEMSEQFQQYQRGRHLAFLQAVEEIKALPSADAEQTDKLENQPCLVERNYTTEGGGREIYHPTRQQGEWIPIEETLPTYDGGEKTWLTGMKCLNCGKLFDLRVGYYFCPNCGAKMHKGGDDE